MKSLSVVTAGLVLGLPQTLAAPSKAQIKWGKCNLPWGKATDAALYGEVECATLKAPLDYTKPDNGKTIDLQLARVKAKVQPAKGSVFYNPGGPGNSAVEYLVTGTEDYYQVLGGQYNLVAVDPRGTGRTLPFNCTIEEEDDETESSKSKLSRRFDVLPQANIWPQVKGETWDSLGEKAERCYKARKETGAFIGTAFSARDIMAAVDALGEDGMLRYWGISYGTVLGQTLAGMFPDRIDRMVLDGNVMIDEYVMGLNPSLVKDTERSMLHLIDECVKSGPKLCPLADWAGSNTTVEILTVAIDEVWTDLLKVSKIPESWGLPEDASFFQGGASFLERIKNHIQQQLYVPSNFGDLAAFIEKMIDEEWADVYEIMYPSSDGEEEEVTEVWNWGEDALDGIYCGDQAYRAETVDDLYSAWALHSEQSSFSDTGASSELTCARWPFKAAETIDMNKFKHVNTKMPILFVNSRYDPITPLVSAYEASTRFNGSRVVVHEGEGHGIHGNPSVCTYTAIIDYFKNGRLPKPGVSCPVKTPIFQMLWEQQEAARNATESE
ncbi:hypothetical protein CDV36_000057 [Fusarium kuroshium]|uniref:Peptidase S33 tripeptidyl aminopeptidase-like C-terminal domain-containing protein n=1 Tax=Fusarium kuroshium TaxID=2010991 RepID=A0A3M2SRM8_9HYPO|nr:hypothetical protein CDV36_000057 [Fusarium kuroshium]